MLTGYRDSIVTRVEVITSKSIKLARHLIFQPPKSLFGIKFGFIGYFAFLNFMFYDGGTKILPQENERLYSHIIMNFNRPLTSSSLFLRSVSLSIFLSSGVWLGCGSAAAQKYQVTDLGNLPGASTCYASDINDGGQIVGTSGMQAFIYENGVLRDISGTGPLKLASALAINNNGLIVGSSNAPPGGRPSAVLFSGNRLQNLGTLTGGNRSSGWSINDQGQVVGGAGISATVSHAYLYQQGLMADLSRASADKASLAQHINNSGLVVGQYDGKACLWKNGVMQVLGILPGMPPSGFADSLAISVNESSQIVGRSTWAKGMRAVIFENGTIRDLGGLELDNDSWAVDINDSGQVVGGARVGNDQHAFLYQNGVMEDLNKSIDPAANWVLTGATAINNRGEIVGSGLHDGTQHAYLLSPISIAKH